jgi:D-cysteine desulfhydrase
MKMKQSTRFSLATLPTPLERMPRLGLALGGCELWIKRDDQTGLAMGGNKARKLEFLIAEALAQGANVILTVGAVQSNHCRQTAAAAAKAGLECILVLPGQMPPADEWTGNLLLDDLLGARIWWAGGEDPLVALEAAAQAERRAGRRPYVISYGGSNAIGASAYARAFAELMDQIAEQGAPRFERILFASGSGGTQAGLIVGARACGYAGQLVGISVGKTAGDLRDVVTGLLAPTAAHLGLELNFGPDDVQIEDGYVGAGYGLVTDAEREAIRVVASTEGILLDPVYTAKAMAALFDFIRRDKLHPGETALFWHTGGAPALFAYHTDLHF